MFICLAYLNGSRNGFEIGRKMMILRRGGIEGGGSGGKEIEGGGRGGII